MRRAVYLLTALTMWAFLLSPAGAQETPVMCDGRQATIVGTPGDNTIVGTRGPDVIAGLQGNDTIRGLGGNDIICGGTGADTIYGGAGFDVIFGAQGDDLIYAVDGALGTDRQDTRGSRIFGGAGNDTIFGSTRWDRMQGGSGNDSLVGFEGRDWIRAGSGRDVVDGGAGIDDLHGGLGDDTIGVTADDIVRGGAGSDRCNYADDPASIRSCAKNKKEGQGRTPEPYKFQPQPFISVGFESESGEFLQENLSGRTSWFGVVHGLVSVGFDQPDAVVGDCYLIVGELTPTRVASGITTAVSDAPDLGLWVENPDYTVLDGPFAFSGNDCNTSEAEALGYRSVDDIEAVLGETVSFFVEVAVPQDNAELRLVVVGDLGERHSAAFEPDYLDELP